jgi:hypothetical protein
LFVCRHPPLQRRHLLLQLPPNLRPLRDLEEHVAEQTSRGIASRQQNINQFVPDALLILRLLRQLVDENVAVLSSSGFLIISCMHGLFPLLVEPHGIVNPLVDVGMADFNRFLALTDGLLTDERVKDAEARARHNILLRVVKRFGEDVVFVVAVVLADVPQTVGGVVEEEFGGCVHGHAEEELLDIHGRSVFGDVLEHQFEVPL